MKYDTAESPVHQYEELHCMSNGLIVTADYEHKIKITFMVTDTDNCICFLKVFQNDTNKYFYYSLFNFLPFGN